MDSIIIENLTKELEKLEAVGGIVGTALVNRNGLTILSKLPREVDERKFGAMAATMLGAMETASTTLGDKPVNLTVEFDDHQLIIIGTDTGIIFLALVDLNVDLGLIFIEIEESIKIFQNVMNG